MCLPFNQANLELFYTRIKKWAETRPPKNIDRFAQVTQLTSQQVQFQLLRLYHKYTHELNYFILSHLQIDESGGYGTIFAGFAAELKENYIEFDCKKITAIKVMKPHISGCPLRSDALAYMGAEFQSEFGTLCSNRSKEDKVYYAMPYHAGLCLLDYMNAVLKDGGLQVNLLLQILLKIAQKIQAMHQKGFVHLDIKPKFGS
jgi:serine/threonine protein kinase